MYFFFALNDQIRVADQWEIGSIIPKKNIISLKVRAILPMELAYWWKIHYGIGLLVKNPLWNWPIGEKSTMELAYW